MTWRALTYGTAVLASLTLGTAIYYSGTRLQVKTEDITELLEALSERQLAIATGITTQGVGWQEAQWAEATPAASWDGTNLLNGYWIYDGTTNPVPTSYLVPAGEIARTNTFISTGQWLRAWVPVYTNIGRTRDILYSQYTVAVTPSDAYSALVSGTYVWKTSLWNSARVAQHIWENSALAMQLVATPQDPTHGWQLLYAGFFPEHETARDGQYGGSIADPIWSDYVGMGYYSLTATPGGSVLTAVTNIVGTITNILPIRPLEFPARVVTNVANAVGILNSAALISAVDSGIGIGDVYGYPEGIIGSYVDMSRASGGKFDVYFAANTNATTLPKLTLRRAFEILGPTCGTNVIIPGPFTNALWLTFPARGTNPPVYGGALLYVTKEALTARFRVLQLMVATELTPTWWTGGKVVKNNWTNSGDFFSNNPYTLPFLGVGVASNSLVTNQSTRIEMSLVMHLSWIHYHPDDRDWDWLHNFYHHFLYSEYQSRLRVIQPFLSSATSAHGYTRYTMQYGNYGATNINMFFATTPWTLTPTNAISEPIILAGDLSPFEAVTLSNVGAPIGPYSPYGYEFASTNVVTNITHTAVAGPTLINWGFNYCRP